MRSLRKLRRHRDLRDKERRIRKQLMAVEQLRVAQASDNEQRWVDRSAQLDVDMVTRTSGASSWGDLDLSWRAREQAVHVLAAARESHETQQVELDRVQHDLATAEMRVRRLGQRLDVERKDLERRVQRGEDELAAMAWSPHNAFPKEDI